MALRWYVVHVHSTFEKKVSEQILVEAKVKGLLDKFEEILIPTEEVIKIKQGKKENSERRLYPGYMLMKMEMNDETWRLVSSHSKVTGFLGVGKKPTAVSEAEANKLIQQLQEVENNPRTLITFEVGERVRVIDGPFVDFDATVNEVDVERTRLKVEIQIFERNTLVDLEYNQVEKH